MHCFSGYGACCARRADSRWWDLGRYRPNPVPTAFDTITFLSDYGHADEFVGVVKGVVRSLAPHVVVLDLCHDIAPHDIRAGGLALARSVQYLPQGVVLAVVDPGVGTDRRAVAVEVGAGDDTAVLVGPDNGLLAPAVAMVGGASRVVALTNADYHLPAPGATFAGRDVFAPAAAHLCNGVALTDLGEEVDPLTLVPGLISLAQEREGVLLTEVLWVDRFGNVQLNIGPDDLALFGERTLLRFREETRVAKQVTTYADVGPGEVGLIVDSYGLVSISLDRRSAAAELRLHPGDGVNLEEPT
jgi:S-adenosyl-L-methionine hydrolase (adenosine-forming)